jgi:hypothetical protein
MARDLRIYVSESEAKRKHAEIYAKDEKKKLYRVQAGERILWAVADSPRDAAGDVYPKLDIRIEQVKREKPVAPPDLGALSDDEIADLLSQLPADRRKKLLKA